MGNVETYTILRSRDDVSENRKRFTKSWKGGGERGREKRRDMNLQASRVAQLDAFMLDRELSKIVSVRVSDALDKLSPGLGSEYALEIDACVDAAILSSTILKNKPTPGMRLNNIMFGSILSSKSGNQIVRASHRMKLAYVVCTVLGTWIWSRLRERSERERWSSESVGWKRKTSRMMRIIDRAMSLVIALNMIVFLQYGNYRGVLERLFKMRLVPIRERAQNPVQFSNQNLQLMSSTLSEMMFFLIPLVNWTRLRVLTSVVTGFILRHGTRFFLFGKTFVLGYVKSLLLMDSSESNKDDDVKNNQVSKKARTMDCAICGTSSVVMAHQGSQCEHIFCYMCVFGLVSDCSVSGISARCPRCHCNITEIQRVSCSFEDENETKS